MNVGLDETGRDEPTVDINFRSVGRQICLDGGESARLDADIHRMRGRPRSLRG